MRFAKLEGAGNDYIYVNGFETDVPNPSALAVRMSDRHFGIGADGLILALPPEGEAHLRMRMFNADGSESPMCGNGVRCLAKFAVDRGLAQGDTVRIETPAGVREVELHRDGGRIVKGSVGMGRPQLAAQKIPVLLEGDRLVDVPLTVGGQTLWMTCVGMGNPHAVFYADSADDWPLETLGPKIENHKLFPERVNAHVVEVVSPGEVIVRTWERGSGATLACGTGASAVCVAGVLTGRTGRAIVAHVPGGDLEVEWPDDKAEVRLTGPVEEVFTGEWPTD
ncbi:MAG: diaminopimelate epimerase [Planctomycetes bacterium DG_20]|nr:MAG: diaminopimelate epimerase [Planctomycetes bacterium DG_20]